jgi:hypothetical protein
MADQFPLSIRRWLIQLGKLTSTRISADEAADYVEANEPMLAIHFPPAAFTLLSLEHVASQCKFLPTYGEITEYLGQWWRQHRPSQPAIERQPREATRERTPEEKAQAAWVASQAIAALRSVAQPVEDRSPPTPRYLTQEQLARAYREAGVKSPGQAAGDAQ